LGFAWFGLVWVSAPAYGEDGERHSKSELPRNFFFAETFPLHPAQQKMNKKPAI